VESNAYQFRLISEITLLTQKTKKTFIALRINQVQIMKWWEEIIAVFNTSGLMV